MQTTNISLPINLYKDAKDFVKYRRYASISELFRDAVRRMIYEENLTINGFPKEFEDQVLKAEKEPVAGAWETPVDVDRFFDDLR